MAAFTTGRALIYHEKTKKPFEVQIAEWIAPNVKVDTSNDIELYELISMRKSLQRAITIAFRNWKEEYLFPVADRCIELQKKYREIDVMDSVEMSCCKSEKMLLQSECHILKQKCYRLEKLWLSEVMKGNAIYKEFEETKKYIDSMQKLVDGIKILMGKN